MTPDDRLLKALVEKVTNYKKSVPIFRIPERRPDELDDFVVQAGLRFVKIAGFGGMRHSIRRERES